MPAPPKPWERAGASGTSASSISPSAASAFDSAATSAASSAPALPERPSSLGSSTIGANSMASSSPYGMSSSYGGMGGMGGMGSSTYGSPYSSSYGGLGSYGGYGGYGSSYSSPYSRMGGMGSYGSYGMGGMGGYGGYGSYGGYGGMGMGGMGMGMPGQPGDPSLTQRMESGTQATFELISSIVGAFGGFAQMLESTFMATHSSFFAMVGVADQFSHLRNYLGQVLSIFALARYLKRLVLKLTGRAPPVDLDPREFKDFATNGGAAGANGRPGTAKPSKRPLVVFFLAVVGLPYLMGKLVKLITARQEAERKRLEASGQLPPGQLALPGAANGEAIDPSKLTFVRALYAYPAADPLELSLKPNDIVAVLSKVDPQTGQESSWWRGRTRDGRIGWFPSTYVESLESAKERAAKAGVEPKAIEAGPAVSASSATSNVSSTVAASS